MCASMKMYLMYWSGLTHSTLSRIHIHIRVKLSWPHGFVRVHVAADALRRVGAQGRGQVVVSLLFIITGGFHVFLLFLSLSPVNIMDTQQQAIVHNLHPHEKLHSKRMQTCQSHSGEIACLCV